MVSEGRGVRGCLACGIAVAAAGAGSDKLNVLRVNR
jgi:hypothetical protein